ncbi:MAG: hypothetical protein GYA47_08880 [Desulfovibrio sp.]|nr:hypothetical protein [Desulfovibrio sp.]
MKYIIFEDFSGKPVPVIFPDRIEFEEMREQVPYGPAISAGMVRLSAGEFVCSGEAKELGVTSRPGDAAVIAAHFTAGQGVAPS